MLLRSIASRTRAVSAVSSLSLARKKSAKNGSYATTCTPGTTITVSFAADLQSSSQAARADVGIWIANDEQSTAMDSGSCSHFYFTPGNDPSSGELPDFEGATADSCGGLGAQELFTEVALKSPETTLQIPCVDTDNDGWVDIDYCASWKVPGQETACPYNGSYRKGTVPGTKSKCKCGRVDTVSHGSSSRSVKLYNFL